MPLFWRPEVVGNVDSIRYGTEYVTGAKYSSKQFGMLTLSVEHNYICFYYKEFTTTTCFGPICGTSSGCGLTYSLGYTSMRVVVMGCNGAGSRSHYITGYHGPYLSYLAPQHKA